MKNKPFEFRIENLQRSNKKLDVIMFVKNDQGNRVTGAEFTANLIQPKLQAYERVLSKNGVINFHLPEGIYFVTVSKRGQFKYNFKPEDIVIEVKNGITYVKKAISREKFGLNNNTTFIVSKVKNPVSKQELKDLIDQAKYIIENCDKYDVADIKFLKDAVISAELDYNNEHTAPMYTQGFINI